MKGSLCLFFCRQHYGPLGSLGCSPQRCRKQKLHRLAFHRGGGGGGGEEVRLKEWNILIQPATCLVPFLKQTSRRLLELSKVMFLSNNEFTVVKQKKVIYYSTKMGRGLCPPQKKGSGPEVPPPTPAPPRQWNAFFHGIRKRCFLSSVSSSLHSHFFLFAVTVANTFVRLVWLSWLLLLSLTS